MSNLSLLLALIAVVCSVAYGAYYQLRAVSPRRTIVKGMATGGLAALALSEGAPYLMVIALTLATAADVMKADRTDRSYMASAVIFLIINLLLAAHFYLHHWVSIEAPLFQFIALVGIATGYGVLIWPYLGGLTRLIIPFMATMILLVFTALGSPDWANVLKMGALIYLCSMGLMGIELIVFKRAYHFVRIVGPAIWFTYWGGLSLMLIGSI